MAGAQERLWNDVVGPAWARHADLYDRTLEPFGLAAMARLPLGPGTRVLDVGCGTGATTVELARRVDPGEVVGADLSRTMLDVARQRCRDLDVGNARFTVVDVERSTMEGPPFDAALSRFGVMFFDDPVQGFTNLARAVRAGGTLAFTCFKAVHENPFIAVPVLTAAAHLDVPPPPPPEAPGPFSLADPDRIRQVLGAAGWVDVQVEAGPGEARLGAADDLVALARRVVEQNPTVAEALARAEGLTAERTVGAVAAALAAHVVDGEVRLGAGTWVVSARRPA